MAEKKNAAQFIPMTSTQAAIGGGVLIGFFALWFLWTAVGDKFICWIGGKNNLSGWVQAIGSILAVLGAGSFPLIHHRYVEKEKKKDKEREARIYMISILPALQGLEDDVRSCSMRYIFCLDENLEERKLKKLFEEFVKWFDQYKNFMSETLHAGAFFILSDPLALRTSYAIGKLKALELDVLRFPLDFYKKDEYRFHEKLKEWREQLYEIANLLRVVNSSIDSEININLIYPTDEEIHGYPYDDGD